MIRLAGARFCFYLGDKVSKVMNLVDYFWWVRLWYPIYSWLMNQSVRLDVDKKVWTYE